MFFLLKIGHVLNKGLYLGKIITYLFKLCLAGGK